MGRRGFKFLIGIPLATIRFMFIAGFVAVILLLASSVLPFIVENAKKPPAVDKAPWAVQTYSYIRGQALPLAAYYAEEYVILNDTPAIANYWEYDGRRYVHRDGIKTFPKDTWGAINVVRRIQ